MIKETAIKQPVLQGDMGIKQIGCFNNNRIDMELLKF